jgi:hypothetical protein
VSIVARLFLYIFLLMLAIGSAAQSRRRSWRSKPAAKLKAGDNSLEKAETAKNPPPAPAVVFEGGAQRQHFYLTVADESSESPARETFDRRPVARGTFAAGRSHDHKKSCSMVDKPCSRP